MFTFTCSTSMTVGLGVELHVFVIVSRFSIILQPHTHLPPPKKSLNSYVLGVIALLHMYVIAGLFIAALAKCLLFVCGLPQIITSMRPDRKWSGSSDTTTRATSIYIDTAIDY